MKNTDFLEKLNLMDERFIKEAAVKNTRASKSKASAAIISFLSAFIIIASVIITFLLLPRNTTLQTPIITPTGTLDATPVVTPTGTLDATPVVTPTCTLDETPVVTPTGTLDATPVVTPTPSATELYDSYVFNALENSRFYTDPLVFIAGSSSLRPTYNPHPDPPKFDFDVNGFVVKVKVCENLEDTYLQLNPSPYRKESKYRLIKFETLEIINGEDVPKFFIYMIPNSDFLDFGVYDSLIISMRQKGVENYPLINTRTNKIEFFTDTVFADAQDRPDLGNVIPFTNGIVDVSLWDNKYWSYGKEYLYSNDNNLVVHVGYTEEQVKDKINERYTNKLLQIPNSAKYSPKVIKPCFQTDDAKYAFEYVSDLNNGVFLPFINYDRIVYYRFINGYYANEYLSISITTEEVEYFSEEYTKEDLSSMINLNAYSNALVESYGQSTPSAPHLDDDSDLELTSLSIYGCYVKVDGEVYGILKTTWIYQKDDPNSYSIFCFFDEEYKIISKSEMKLMTVDRERAAELLGRENIYMGKYELFELPMC